MTLLSHVLADIAEERERQGARWGEQNHPDGTGGRLDRLAAWNAKGRTERLAAVGRVTWRAILEEEVFEAFAEEDPERLREELVQVCAVAAAWVEALDRRAVARMQEGAKGADRVLIVAGDARQARSYRLEHGLTERQAPYASSPHVMQGWRGRVAFVGTWRFRKDAGELLDVARAIEARNPS